MIKKADILIVVFIVLNLCAVNLRAEIIALTPNSNSIVQDGIEYYIQTDKAVYNLGENVEILYSVTNLTENPISLGEGPPWTDCYHSIVKDGAENEVWHWTLEQTTVLPMVFGVVAYSSRECERLWNMMNYNGTWLYEPDDFPVPPGLYTVTGELWLDEPYQIVPVSVSIEIIPEPATVLLLALGSLFLTNRRR